MAGFIGVLSTLLIDVQALVRILPVTQGTALPMSPWLIKLVGLIQPTIILAAATLVGVLLAEKVGLSSPAFEAFARGDSVIAALRTQIVPGLVGGLIGAIAVLSSWIASRAALPQDFVARAEQFNRLLPIPTRLLYGGITEEVLVRWGLLTLLVWACWRVFQHGQGKPKNRYLIAAILVSSIVFGLGHLPIALALGRLTLPIGLFIVPANSIFGLIAGYLFWRKGLEAAMIAHMLTHLGIVSASHFAR